MDSETNLEPFIYVGPLIHSVSLNKLEIVTNGILVVSNGKIVAFQKDTTRLENLKKEHKVSDKNVFKLQKNQFLIPGFIDTHIHGPQYPNAGLGYDLPLLDWLTTYTFPLEKKFSDGKFAEKVYTAVVKKTLANGTTTACYFATIHKDSSCIFAKCVQNIGQRAFVGKVNMNKNTPEGYGETYEESVKSTKEFIEKILAMKSSLVKPIITPRFALSCDMKLMKTLGQMAAQYNVLIQTHVSENVDEVKQVKEEFPDCENYVDVYYKAGLVNGKTILAHGIHLTPEEVERVKNTKATISHCASSNILLQSGVCPMRRYITAGLKLSLGTDCSGGNSCSMLDAIRQTLFLSNQATMNGMGKRLCYDEAFYLATLAGAQALCLEEVTGNFQTGKFFDAILVDLNDNSVDLLEEYNLDQLFQKFIYLGDDRMMKKVYVQGRVVKQC